MLGPRRVLALISFSALGMMALVLAADCLTRFVALEVMSIAMYVLAGLKRQRAFSAEPAMKYFIVGSFASALPLLGIAFIYGVTGEISLVGVAKEPLTHWSFEWSRVVSSEAWALGSPKGAGLAGVNWGPRGGRSAT